jgi:hypothetical protein
VNIWQILDIPPSGDERAIKRAYAVKLKVTRPEDDAAAFQLLNDAFERALAHARHRASALAQADDDVTEPAETPARTPVEPARAPAGPNPAEVAASLWATFVAASAVQPRLALTNLAASDAMLNMDVREQFELCAARYCVGEACTEALRDAITSHYRWGDDDALIARTLPRETQFLRAWLRSEQAYKLLLIQQDSNPAVKALLGTRSAWTWIRSCDAGFMRKMRALLDDIETYYPELLHFKLDAECVAAWQRRVERKRYYVQTAFFSIFAGFLLAAMCREYLPSAGIDEPYARYAAFAVFGLALLVPALLALTRTEPFAWLHRIRSASELANYLDDIRYRSRWQFGWLAPFAAASVALFIPTPSPLLRLLVGATLLGCTLVASFVNWGLIPGWNFFIAVVVGISFGSSLSAQGLAFDTVSCMLAAFCALLVLYRGGADFLSNVSLGDNQLMLLRGAWIAGMALLVCGAQWAGDHPHAYPAIAWLWLLAGMLLSHFASHFFFAVIGSAVLRSLVQDAMPQHTMLKAQPMSLLLAGLLLVTILLAFNMVQSRRH